MIMELELEPLRLPSDKERPLVIAGPCSAETEEQVMSTARNLAAKGCHIFRAGVWKPRTNRVVLRVMERWLYHGCSV